ncbi:dephospho-CoA kinase [Rhodohalobacter sp. SW132]|uniref:dephospho-CoA kinase n=1 Tax=Rhodohalobacter sp. SW132 TaxID=2293433 RepID=UPI000E233D67|nr:dephospho-CoA kinase [Rhodohalobacter sp. SW132]REL33635.1 dephospho-CoA kinase [Rhodohalobacter sp. SW132]
MITVGLTGGIGSGKTTVARLWKKRGAVVIFADDLAKEMMRTDSKLKKKLIEVFGRQTYRDDGSLNKPHLIREAFEKNRVSELNGIVHPAIQKKTKQLIEDARASGVRLFVYEAAILLNNGRPDYVDKVVLVTADREKRLERVSARDDSSEAEIIARMEKQPDFDSLHHLADYILFNNGTEKELKERAEEMYQKLIGNN